MKNPIQIDDVMLGEMLNSKSVAQLRMIQKYIDYRVEELVFQNYLERERFTKGSEDVLDIDVLDGVPYSNLSGRTFIKLAGLKLRTLRQIRDYGKENLARTPGIGKAVLKQLEDLFEWWGHQF